MTLSRSSEMFERVVREYWEYYRELEDDFLATRKYVAIEEGNLSAFSLEYLKLFQATCGEIDAVGKLMASLANDAFKADDGRNNILKWWYEVQGTYHLHESTDNALERYDSGPLLGERRHRLLDRLELAPWRGFRVEEYRDKHGRRRLRPVATGSTPTWWKDYNKVKHSRAGIGAMSEGGSNYSRANLGNVAMSLAALYGLETALMQAVGTRDDLEAFADRSRLFHKVRFATSKGLIELISGSRGRTSDGALR